MKMPERWPPLAPTTRFWLKVYPRGDCWEWRGYRNHTTGYGRFNLDRETVTAHRFAFEQTKGLLPRGRSTRFVVDHTCAHSWCVRPSHLVYVTRRENLLRGHGMIARRARDTVTCPHGHLWADNNLYRRPDGSRVCRACGREHNRRRAHRLLEADE